MGEVPGVGVAGAGRRRRRGIVFAVMAALLGVVGLPGLWTAVAPAPAEAATTATISSFDMGTSHGCAVMSDASLSCWGTNGSGQSTPPAGTFSKVATGYQYTCVIKADQSIDCWGRNDDGAVTAVPSGDFVEVAAGARTVCAIRSTGSLACWGKNGSGVVSSAPTSGTYTAVSIEDDHACAVSDIGAISCWGDDTDGKVSGAPTSGTYTAVALGQYHSCALDTGGAVVCWGYDRGNRTDPPELEFTSITAQKAFACGLLATSGIACWGEITFGQGSPSDGPFTAVSAGEYVACGSRADGRVDCWGDNFDGRSGPVFTSAAPPATVSEGAAVSHQFAADHLGSGGSYVVSGGELPPGVTLDSDGLLSGTASTPGEYRFEVEARTTGVVSDFGWVDMAVTDVVDVVLSLDVGSAHGCAVLSGGSLSCWGSNYSGESTPPAGAFSKVAAGYNYTCAIKADQSITCWGKNDNGAVSAVPSGDFVEVAAGARTVCAIRSTGSLACWGKDGHGVVSDVPTLGSYTAVSIEDDHACAVSDIGAISCWGNDDDGQVSGAPTSGTFTAVALGSDHSCALDTGGAVVCWGYDGSGRTDPPGLVFTSISAQTGFTCGLLPTSEIACWGSNSYGATSPPAGAFAAVSAGDRHACGIREDGRVDCWGRSSEGMSGPTFTSPAPAGSVFQGVAVSHQFTASHLGTGGSFAVSDGELPPELTLSTDGLLSGSPTTPGEYRFEVEARTTGVVSDFQWVDVVVGAPAPLGGVVSSEAGPAAGALVLAYAPGDSFWYPTLTAETGADGSYGMALEPGTYSLLVAPPAGSGLVFSVVNAVAVTGTPPVTVDVSLADGTSISGTVTGPEGPVAGATVSAFEASSIWLASATTTTGPDGVYIASGLPAGDYLVKVSVPVGSGLTGAWFDGSPSRGGATTVAADTTVSGVDVALVAGAALSGTVSGPDGVLASATVQVFDVASPWMPAATVVTEADGSFVIDTLSAASYRVRIVAPDGSGLATLWFDGPDEGDQIDIFTVVGGDEISIDAALTDITI